MNGADLLKAHTHTPTPTLNRQRTECRQSKKPRTCIVFMINNENWMNNWSEIIAQFQRNHVKCQSMIFFELFFQKITSLPVLHSLPPSFGHGNFIYLDV